MALIISLMILFSHEGYGLAQDEAATLSGQVQSQSGSPLPGVKITAVCVGNTSYTYTDSRGKFRCQVPAQGGCDVVAELYGFVTIVLTGVPIKAEENSLTVTLKQGGPAEQIIVSASRTERMLIHSPAAVSVISDDVIENSPAQNYGDLLRHVPGLNVTQTSARDVNLVFRESAGVLARSQLVLLDHRTLYLDFLGFVAWDFIPVTFNEIKKIEVIRGPASAVWGANAQTGVVNIITKDPAEIAGFAITLSGGILDRNIETTIDQEESGGLFGANIRFADVINDKWSYKLSGGYFTQSAFTRPAGRVPVSTVPETMIRTGGGLYPEFHNSTTDQPKFDFRLDQNIGADSKISYSAGVAETSGILHGSFGPNQIENGSIFAYGKANYRKTEFNLNLFVNVLDAAATNLFTRDEKGNLIKRNDDSETYNLDVCHSITPATRHLLTYGMNYRHSSFDLDQAPAGNDRDEIGGFVQDEIVSGKFRFSLGARIDKFSGIDQPIFSPRLAVLFEPVGSHVIRASFNRAFRSPSLIDNFLENEIRNTILLPGLNQPFSFPILAFGNQNLKEESLTAYELGYTGGFGGHTIVGFSYYRNLRDDNINFTPVEFYSSKNPPPGWPLPRELVPTGFLPSKFSFLNLGPVSSQGIEVSMNRVVTENIMVFANYSWQDDPRIQEQDADQIPYPAAEFLFPPTHRFNFGINYSGPRFLGSAFVNYTDDAFWTDVLDSRFHGPTEAFRQVNTSFGVRWLGGRLTTIVKITNLFNEEIQQHVFGDILRRSVVGEISLGF